MVYFPTKTYQKPSRTSCDFFEGLLFAFSKDVAKIPSAVSGATRLTRSPTWDIFQSIALKLSELRNSMGFFLIFCRRMNEHNFSSYQFSYKVDGPPSRLCLNEPFVDFQARQDVGFRFHREEGWKSCGSWNWWVFQRLKYMGPVGPD